MLSVNSVLNPGIGGLIVLFELFISAYAFVVVALPPTLTRTQTQYLTS